MPLRRRIAAPLPGAAPRDALVGTRGRPGMPVLRATRRHGSLGAAREPGHPALSRRDPAGRPAGIGKTGRIGSVAVAGTRSVRRSPVFRRGTRDGTVAARRGRGSHRGVPRGIGTLQLPGGLRAPGRTGTAGCPDPRARRMPRRIYGSRSGWMAGQDGDAPVPAPPGPGDPGSRKDRSDAGRIRGTLPSGVPFSAPDAHRDGRRRSLRSRCRVLLCARRPLRSPGGVARGAPWPAGPRRMV